MEILNELYKQQNLLVMDKIFTELKKGKNINSNVKELSKILKKEFNIQAKVELIKEYNQFFGMRIYPAREEIRDMVVKIIDKDNENPKFEMCTNVIIELDHKIFDSSFIDFDPKELTAIMIHEIGHKAFSVKTQEIIRSHYKKQSAALGLSVISLAFAPAVYALITIPVLMIFSSLNNFKTFTDIEIAADSFSIKYGYGDYAYSGLNKISKLDGASFIDDQGRRRMIRWSLSSAIHLALRKNALIKEIEEEIKNSNSDYEKEVLQDQLKIIRRKPVAVMG
jgi:hypothetical protein